MKKPTLVLSGVWLLPTIVFASDPHLHADQFWAQWRGPRATGVAPHGDPPLEWSESKNIRWKVEVPGEGHATPIIWGDRVYIQTAVKTDKVIESPKPEEPEKEEGGRRRRMPVLKPTHVYQFRILAYDRKTGKLVWEKTVREELPHEGHHEAGSLASGSPITDGEHLFAYFGSRGLYAFDMSGKLLWEKDLGDMETRRGFGEGSSPVIYADTIVINWDHEGDSFITALDKKTGENRWKMGRDEVTTWATPLVLEADGKPQVVMPASNRIRSYDLASGALIWECGGLSRNVIPSPVSDHGLVYVMSGYRGYALRAIRYAQAKGDITDTQAVAWTHDDATPYVPSPLLYDDALYFLASSKGILSCFDARTGKEHYGKQRLDEMDGGVYASPVGAKGRVYVTGRRGVTQVIRHGPTFEVLATNKLDDDFDASAAIVGKELYLRGHKNLYCIAHE